MTTHASGRFYTRRRYRELLWLLGALVVGLAIVGAGVGLS